MKQRGPSAATEDTATDDILRHFFPLCACGFFIVPIIENIQF